MKQSTRQRFVSLQFDYPPPALEQEVIEKEAGIDGELAGQLVAVGQRVRNLADRGLEEGVSTRLLVYAAKLVARGVLPRRACEVAFARSLTDDHDLQRGILEIIRDFF